MKVLWSVGVARRLVGAVVSAVMLAVTPVQVEAQRIEPIVVIEGRFERAEGLAFNGEGRLFMAANRTVWEVNPDGTTRQVASFASNLGLAAIGKRDLLFADFGPLILPDAGVNDDGVVWRVTPEGDTTRLADGIGDPNAFAVLPNGEVLFTDDFTNHIYRIDANGVLGVFTDLIPYPNGIVLAPDGSALYAAQIFTGAPTEPPPARLTGYSDAVWRLPLENLQPSGPPEVIFRTGSPSGPDGLAMDVEGRLYLTAARAGELWRIDPATGEGELLADGLPWLASVAFGQGAFDQESLYATQIAGGRLLRFPVGVKGAALHTTDIIAR